MISMEQIKKNATRLADSAVQVGTEIYQKGKNKIDLLTLENKLAKAQRQLGALVYSLQKNGEENAELVARYISAIAAIEQKIEAYGVVTPETPTAAAQDAATTVLCPQCGAEVDPDAIFCPGCGYKL
ncbi:MAG: zinc ribbon domain-containing protein [Ruthenibacterium sp.]